MTEQPKQSPSPVETAIIAAGKDRYGDNWDKAAQALAEKGIRGDLSQQDAAKLFNHPDVAGKIFNEGMSEIAERASAGDKAAERIWREYRDGLPDRQRWRDRQR